MSKLAERLKDASRSGVYRVTSDAALADARRIAGLPLHRIAVGPTKKALLDRFAATLRFPGTFGRNWDALKDCLSDLAWLGGAGHVLLLHEFERLPDEDRRVLVQVLEDAAAVWRAHPEPFFAVFLDPGRRLSLPDLHRER